MNQFLQRIPISYRISSDVISPRHLTGLMNTLARHRKRLQEWLSKFKGLGQVPQVRALRTVSFDRHRLNTLLVGS